MADLPLKAPQPPVDFPPPFEGGVPRHGPLIIRFIQHIASSFLTLIVGFGGELAAQASQTEQQLTLTHPHG